MAALRSDYQEALIEDDEYRCTSCDRLLTDSAIQIITAYRSGEKWQDGSILSEGSVDAYASEASTSTIPSNVKPERQAWQGKKNCAFRRGTIVWTLSFEGETAHVNHLTGMNYIAELLRHPRTPIEAEALVASIRGNTDVVADTAEERVVGAGAAMPGIPLTDAQAIKAVSAELKNKRGELRDSSTADEAARTELQRQISKLQNYLAQVQGHNARPRMTGGIASRARSRVKHAIDRAIKKIGAQHLPL